MENGESIHVAIDDLRERVAKIEKFIYAVPEPAPAQPTEPEGTDVRNEEKDGESGQ